MNNEDSVTEWIATLKAGDESAAQRLWDRYFRQLATVAGRRLNNIARLPADGEDVALSAMHSLCAGAKAGRFADVSDRDSLWKLLVAITVRKAQHVVRDEFRQKRGGGKLVGESAILGDPREEVGAHGFEQILGREPTPEFAAQVEDELQRLFNLLPDPELVQIASYKMQGMTSQDVASRIGKALATVERRLKLIRSLWAESKLT